MILQVVTASTQTLMQYMKSLSWCRSQAQGGLRSIHIPICVLDLVLQ